VVKAFLPLRVGILYKTTISFAELNSLKTLNYLVVFTDHAACPTVNGKIFYDQP
jgi:hypothetical protein